MPRVKLFFGEAFRSIGANLSTTVAATMTVLIGMFLLGLFIALFSWVNSWTDHVRKDVLVKVFFVRDASPSQINAVKVKLQTYPETKTIVFVSPQDALNRMREKYPDLVQNLVDNPLPPAFEVTPNDADQVTSLANRLQPLPVGVDKVDYAEKKTERILAVTNVIKYIFLLGSIILMVASTILIANTIRLSIFSRRREVEVMKLVGASNWFVRGPFMLEGVICGLIGAVIAVIMLVLAKELALPVIEGHSSTFREDDVHALSFPVTALILIGVALAVGAAGSGITLRRFLRV
ncbi:MAG TPA: permease-like cell division protein FtsX [Gaiellaceae bacterium]|jgi:cell division transport system permease protein|nr:permease-like cell division protein FtsX [Gaiellaceae bacterium]